MRAELLSIEQLKRYAVTLASQHRTDFKPGSDKLLPRLADNERVLLAAYDIVTAVSKPGQRIVPAEAWLIDNFYLIEQQIGTAKRLLPRGYSRQLPRLLDGTSIGFPRIYDLALALISHMDGRVDNDNVTQFVAAYQASISLQLGELWAFPIMLQLALLENLRRVALRIARRREERNVAITWANRMLATAEKEPKRLIQLLAEFANADVPLTAPFVEEFYASLQAQGPAMAFVQTWIEQQLLEQGVTATQLAAADARTAATNQISIANSIGSLRVIGAIDWREFVESLSFVEQQLRLDPAGLHANQDFATRDRYRHVIEDLARRCEYTEIEIAEKAVQMAQEAVLRPGKSNKSSHVGYYLIDRGRIQLEQEVGCHSVWKLKIARASTAINLFLYLVPILTFTTLITTAALGSFTDLLIGSWRYWILSITGMIAASAMVIPLVNRLVTLILPPRVLPRMDYSKGIPSAQRTMVVVPTLLSTRQEVDNLLEAMEIRYLGNRDTNLFFAILSDFRDAPEKTLPGDSDLLAYARASVQALNNSYEENRSSIFYLFHRPRVWNPHEEVWMGYERKRGKLEQFNALLRGEAEDGFFEIEGDVSILKAIAYVITLDTDTQLPRDTANALIGNMAHPINRPQYDADKGRIVEGYAILQPRTSISLICAAQSRFSKLFAGESGIDPYTREVSDVYQDMFGEGSFVGKGIYDVDAFREAVDGRFPENLILSHDLLEGGYARSALVTDIEFIEEHPSSYAMEASRRHRWIRGDWQLAGWLLPRVPAPYSEGSRERKPANPLAALSIWKILDNLRRSLISMSLLIILASSWLSGAGSSWIWSLFVVAILIIPVLFNALIELVRRPAERDRFVHWILTYRAAQRPIMAGLLTLAFLPYDAFICLDAIFRSGVQMLFTRRGLLIWQLASYTRRNASRTRTEYYREMWIGPALAITLPFAFWQSSLIEWLSCAPILLLWLTSPILAWWISTPLGSSVPQLNQDQQKFLRTLTRRTWRYFSDFVGPLDNWLPPDNYQEYPIPTIASRTSPTNIGMALLANQSAYDFGYLCATEFLQRTDNTLTAMEKLERYRGHFYNWYDTRTLLPLHPKYVSSVDSGNLAGCLLTLQAGLEELKNQPVLSKNVFPGLKDTLQILADQAPAETAPDLVMQIRLLQDKLSSLTINGSPKTLTEANDVLSEVRHIGTALIAWLPSEVDTDDELHYWALAFDKQSRAIQDDLEFFVPSPMSFNDIPTLNELYALSSPKARERRIWIDDLISRCRELAQMDFEFLYDSSRCLLSIGYDVGERRRDPACYDLLASEARLASFLLIAQGQIPQKHWFALGRLLTSHLGEVSLISWSGSMFEYLMPGLIMPSYENTLLEQTCKSAVARQIEYGRQRAVPWGISESCYNTTDMHQVYQYRAFGVPGMGLKRGLGDDLVIAPYATALALTVAPLEACRNLQMLSASGFSGDYGLYEAIDYTASRVPRGKNYAIVRAFMAHHQGMSLLAFAHLLLNQPMQRRFLSDPAVRATDLLLQERVPKKGATLHPHTAEVSAAARPVDADSGTIVRSFTDPDTAIPEVHLLSNGKYHVMANHAGGGNSSWRNLAVTRWREDITLDNWGTFVYLRDTDTGNYWSTTYQPTLRKADHYEAIFVQAKAEYRRRDESIEAHTEISVSPEDDVEIRRITLTNLTSRIRHIEVTSYAEVLLVPLNTDLAHRVFSNLFVQTEILPDQQA
ncbi:MAG TPA: glucoamylase family protein, partial [Halioglobus sp.]